MLVHIQTAILISKLF